MEDEVLQTLRAAHDGGRSLGVCRELLAELKRQLETNGTGVGRLSATFGTMVPQPDPPQHSDRPYALDPTHSKRIAEQRTAASVVGAALNIVESLIEGADA